MKNPLEMLKHRGSAAFSELDGLSSGLDRQNGRGAAFDSPLSSTQRKDIPAKKRAAHKL